MQNPTPEKVVTARYLYPFILVTSLFALWGFANVGGAFLPRMQGAIIDGEGMTLFGQTLESVRVSFFLPVICFIVIAIYGFLSNVLARKAHPGNAL